MAIDATQDAANGVKLLGEVLVPGASQFIDGNVKSGSIHLLGAIASVALLGPAGALVSVLVRGNSYTTSTLQKPLHRALFDRLDRDRPAIAARPVV
jgi:hypothetical protein